MVHSLRSTGHCSTRVSISRHFRNIYSGLREERPCWGTPGLPETVKNYQFFSEIIFIFIKYRYRSLNLFKYEYDILLIALDLYSIFTSQR